MAKSPGYVLYFSSEGVEIIPIPEALKMIREGANNRDFGMTFQRKASAEGYLRRMTMIARKNPLTRSEAARVRAEADIHKGLGYGSHRRTYYNGMAAGMRDIAEEYEMENLETNPVRARRLPRSKKYRVTDAGRVTAFRTTKKKAQAQARLLRGIAHGMVPRRNPASTEIYRDIVEIVARKGPGHKCDPACKKAGHTYIHRFKKRGTRVFGNPDGSLTIVNTKK